MIDFTKIKDVISVLPLLIIYILPGYIFITVKNFIINKKQIEDQNIILKSIVISYVIINCEKLVFNFDIASSKAIVNTIIITIIASYLYSRFIQSNRSNKILSLLKITSSLKEETLIDVIDFDIGMWVRVYLNSEELIYTGKVRRFEKVSDANYNIVLSNYILYNFSCVECANYSDNNTQWVLINVKDNYRIELIYDPKSKKIID